MLRILLLLHILLVSSPLLAQPVIFFGEDWGPGDNTNRLDEWPNASSAFESFLLQAGSIGMVDLEDLPANATAPIDLDFGGVSGNLTGRGEIRGIETGTYAGTYPTSGSQFWLVDNPTAPFTIEFDSPQNAFGFFASDIADFYGTILVSLSDGREIPIPAHENWPSGSVLFFGIIDNSEPFSAVTLVPDTIDHGWGPSVDGFGIDDLVIGRMTPIPVEPTNWGNLKALYR